MKYTMDARSGNYGAKGSDLKREGFILPEKNYSLIVAKCLLVIVVLGLAIFWVVKSDQNDTKLNNSFVKCQKSYTNALQVGAYQAYMQNCMN